MSTKTPMSEAGENPVRAHAARLHRDDRDTEMEKTQMVIRKRVEGEVQYNDGEFAEILTIGLEGNEEGLLLETFQIHQSDTENTPEEFRQRFPVGTTLSILTITEITTKSAENISEGQRLRYRRLATKQRHSLSPTGNAALGKRAKAKDAGLDTLLAGRGPLRTARLHHDRRG